MRVHSSHPVVTPLSVRTMTLRPPDHPYDDGPVRAVSASVVPDTRWR
ncbi:protein of unknown function [Azospirillum baldaniorum]|uniref:Uncharacterized protein n=1 Tax=Azospirillum baldaniorum TaxID=1064539 RepID=A0A9P1NKZ8_9PROT|nr:protein of unknown function [Azospirillum baldaniorum]